MATTIIFPVVDDFGIAYVGKQHANHLIQAISRKTVNSLKIGLGPSAAASPSNRTTKPERPHYQRRATNINTRPQKTLNMLPTLGTNRPIAPPNN
jgi:hypothetical protein